jgi:oxygen-independent coproporphyrinogen-3 oxidase
VKNTLLAKYNVPGPRYTSYPTVPYWETTPTAEQWIASIGRALDASTARGQGAALYVHIPFCESLCTYCGCNTRITRNHAVAHPYIETVLKEWDLYLQALGRDRVPLADLHLGGGTPTFLSSAELEHLMQGLLSKVDLQGDVEFSVEADPRVTTAEQLETLARFGFRRLSLGIQDFDPKVQEIVHRVQSEEQVARLTQDARAQGYTSVNYDLIYGLPFQTRDSIRQTIGAVMRLRPDRIAFYAYAHVPWIKPSQRRFTEADLPSGEEKRALYELGREMLESAGYREIGMDHFALETDGLWKSSQSGSLHRNFMGYTSRLVSPLIGLGVSAIGDSWEIFAQNEKHLEAYQRSIAEGKIPLLRGHVLTPEDLSLRRHVLDLMTQMKTQWGTGDAALDFLKDVPMRLVELEKDGLVRLSANSCEITDAGRTFLRNTCMAFDARLVRKAPSTELFSKTV